MEMGHSFEDMDEKKLPITAIYRREEELCSRIEEPEGEFCGREMKLFKSLLLDWLMGEVPAMLRLAALLSGKLTLYGGRVYQKKGVIA
ncbi:hypothetical protein NPIL_173711 [Nephila pilipes]|uniref:Uncharacterized protein n=1 Tax=Nephila pilipes TaxID=299642 RepID=A0A8X6UU13_NEPPI|nr:hypothetical protein NPIL_173711 [Nephila pilipes]